MKIIKYRKIWVIVSVAVVAISIPIIALWRPPLGIDFTGGALIEIKTEDDLSVGQVRETVAELAEKKAVVVQESGESQFIVRTSLEGEGEYRQFEGKLKEKFKGSNILRHESIGSSVGKATARNAIYAIILSGVLIVIYLAISFRKVPRSVSPWAFGGVALLALIHDLGLSFAVYSIIAKTAGYEIDSSTLVAALTILGFSVHDTIVVFDRVRENVIKNRERSFAANAQISINQTIARSLNTSLTTILILIALFMLGGATIKSFTLLLAVGIGIGTYSSIFVASPILVALFERATRQRSQKRVT